MMISRQRERISSNLTSLMREHNKVATSAGNALQSSSSSLSSSSFISSSSGSSQSSSSWERLLGLSSGFNQSASSSLFDFDCEFIEEEMWEEFPSPDSQQQLQQRNSTTVNVVEVENNRLLNSKWLTPSRSQQTPLSRIQLQESSASGTSKPVNVPDWSKILQNSSLSATARLAPSEEDDSDKENDADHEWVPPHTLAARQDAARIRTSSGMIAFSVLEGAGRTLKGRDLSRVRNSVWRQTGYMAV